MHGEPPIVKFGQRLDGGECGLQDQTGRRPLTRQRAGHRRAQGSAEKQDPFRWNLFGLGEDLIDRKSTRLNSSHGYISYAVSCLIQIRSTWTRLESARRRGLHF